MKEEWMRAAVVLLLSIALAGCMSIQRGTANQLLGEWYIGIADPDSEEGFTFREDAVFRFEEKYLYVQDGGTVIARLEYAIEGNYLTLFEEGEPIRMRIEFKDENTFILYRPSIEEMLGEMSPDKNVVVIGGDEEPIMAGKRK
jgi:hypothetical protein